MIKIYTKQTIVLNESKKCHKFCSFSIVIFAIYTKLIKDLHAYQIGHIRAWPHSLNSKTKTYDAKIHQT